MPLEGSSEFHFSLAESITYRYFAQVKTEPAKQTASRYLEQLAKSGLHSFTSSNAKAALGVSYDATRLALNRLSRQGRIASPARGFYVIVTPEYRSLGCLPAEQFIPDLMKLKGLNYYVGLLSAAQYYGAAHQRPQEFQVFLAKNRRPIQCGKVRVKFIARKLIDDVPVRSFNTARGELRVSTPESTAIDLVGYPEHVGGLDQVATILSELADKLDPDSLADAAKTAPLPWVQRLGYILDSLDAGQATEGIRGYVQQKVRDYKQLLPSGKILDGPRVRRWKLIANVELDPDI